MFRKSRGTISYAQASAKLGKREKIALCQNTWIHRDEDNPSLLCIKYYHTDIITMDAAGNTVLDNGGWHTSSTRDRMTAFTRFGVWTENGDWAVRGSDGVLYEYENGMTVDAQGIPDTVPVFVSVLSEIIGKKLETATETAIAIEGLDLEGTEKLWKKCWKHRDFIAKYCIPKFLPMTLGYRRHRFEPSWNHTVAERLRGVTNACTPLYV
jgi:hypothetical protein